ncbi:MAG TPA: bifunctional oligoribonuclease/PAP phosphatase NrnA, partial [Longimicrobiales bacterium]
MESVTVRYRTPSHRRGEVRGVLNALMASRRAVLTTHVNADGDGVGSQVALAAWLRACGTDAWIINPTPFPDLFGFLLPDSNWVVDASSSRAQDLCDQADLAVVLDTGEIPRIGRVKPLIEELKTAVLDHHPPGPNAIGGVSFRDPGACATGEMVYDVVLAANGPWPQAVLDGIYVAILTDTGCFRFSNSTAGSHRVAADLIERGVDPEALHRQVYGASPLRRLRLLQVCLGTLDADEDVGVAWMSVPKDAADAIQATPDDLEGLVDYPRSVEGAAVGLLFRQTSKGDTKVSFRANEAVDMNALARQFGGGGHVRASGALVSHPIEEAIPLVVEATRAAVRAARDGEAS